MRSQIGSSGVEPATDSHPTWPSALDRLQQVVLAGHRNDEAAVVAGTTDPAATVRAGAYSALARLGRWTAARAAAALKDPDPQVRRRGCELTGRASGSQDDMQTLLLAVLDALDDNDPWVVEAAAWALGELATATSTATSTASANLAATVARLVAVAGDHADALCREAAVAALGAIGDPAGLDAVLGALTGKPPLRRRAAVALAGFDDPAADEALRKCLADRDWQVREVAEELVGGSQHAADPDC